jgi:Zn-dependent M16 (insulinase) family peptidase
MELFLYGLTEEVRQEHRQRLLQCTVQDVVEVAQRCLSPALADGSATIAVVGSQQKLPSLSTTDGWIVRNTSDLSLPMPFDSNASLAADILKP